MCVDPTHPKHCVMKRNIITTSEHNRRILKRVIRAVLIEEPTFHYYQGFHDIVEFLLVYSQFRVDWTYTLVKRLMHSYLR